MAPTDTLFAHNFDRMQRNALVIGGVADARPLWWVLFSGPLRPTSGQSYLSTAFVAHSARPWAIAVFGIFPCCTMLWAGTGASASSPDE